MNLQSANDKSGVNNKPSDGGSSVAGYESSKAMMFTRIRSKLSNNRLVVKSITALMSSKLLTAVLTALGGMLVAHYLGPEITGAFRVYTIPLTYLIFLHLGTWDGLWRQIPYFVGKDQPEQVEEIASAAAAFNLIVSVVVSIGFIVCAGYSFAQNDLFGVFGWLTQVLACWRTFYGGYLTSTYRTLHHFVSLSKIQVTQAVVAFGMVFLLPLLGFFGLCARVAFPSFLVVWLFHKFRPLRVKYHFNSKSIWDLIKIGLPFSIWGNIYTSFWIATESALVLYLEGATSLGLFTIAVVMRAAIDSIPKSVWQVLTPRVVTSLAKDGSVRRANDRIVWVTVALVICMVLVAFIGSYVLDMFVPYFMPMYVDGLSVMKICLWFSVIEAAFLPANVLFATGRPWLFGRSVIVGVIIFPLATYFLEPVVGGLLAVAIGSLIGRTSRTIAAYVDLAILTRHESTN